MWVTKTCDKRVYELPYLCFILFYVSPNVENHCFKRYIEGISSVHSSCGLKTKTDRKKCWLRTAIKFWPELTWKWSDARMSEICVCVCDLCVYYVCACVIRREILCVS